MIKCNKKNYVNTETERKKTPKEDFQKNALDMISYECS